MNTKTLTILLSVCCLLSAQADSILVPSRLAGVVKKVRISGTAADWLTGLTTPEHAILDGNGDALVADSGTGKVWRYPVGGVAAIQVGPDLPGVSALAMDGSGVLFALSGGGVSATNTVYKLNDTGDGWEVFGAAIGAGAQLTSLVVSGRGEAFVADRAGDRIIKIGKAGPNVTVSDFSTAVTDPFGLAFDAASKLHASDAGEGGRIVTFKNNGALEPAVATGLGASLRGLCFDSVGSLFFLRDNAGAGELCRLEGGAGVLIAGALGDVSLPTARGAQKFVMAYKNQLLSDPPSAAIATVNSPAIGGGVTAFKATLAKGVGAITAANNHGIWKSDGAGGLTLVAQRGGPLPGASGAVYSVLSDPMLNRNGEIAFLSTLALGDTSAATNWALVTDAHNSAALTMVLRKGQGAPVNPAAPDVVENPSIKFTAIRQYVLLEDVGPAFLASIAGPGVNLSNNLGLWSLDRNGLVTLVLRKGTLVTCADGKSRKLTDLSLLKAPVLAQGQGRHVANNRAFVHRAKFSDGYSALVKLQAGAAPVLLEEKKGAVGAALPTALFSTFNVPAVSAIADDFLFRASMTAMPGTTDVTKASAWGLFARDALGDCDLRARLNFAAASVPDAVYATFSDPVTSPGGAFAFWGKMKPGLGGVTTATAAALWEDGGTGLSVVARQGGASVPGIPGAVKFTSFTRLVLPDAYGTLFSAKVAGQGITTANDIGLWAHDGEGGVELLLREGDNVEVAGTPKKVKTITVFKPTPKQNGQSRHFDDDGTVTCLVLFTDVSKAVLVIEQP